MEAELRNLIIPDRETALWFRDTIEAAFGNDVTVKREQKRVARKRLAEVRQMQERCLDLRISGSIDETTFEAKKSALHAEMEELERQLDDDFVDPQAGETALAVYDFSQQALDFWHGSNFSVRREILDAISSNRMLGDVSLDVAKRSPFDKLAERASFVDGRGDWI